MTAIQALTCAILALQPSRGHDRAEAMAVEIVALAEEYDFDPIEIAGLASHETDFRPAKRGFSHRERGMWQLNCAPTCDGWSLAEVHRASVERMAELRERHRGSGRSWWAWWNWASVGYEARVGGEIRRVREAVNKCKGATTP